MENQTENATTLAMKLGGLWAFIGVTSWNELSSFLASCLTLYILCRYVWKDFVRPFFERRGWLAAAAADDES